MPLAFDSSRQAIARSMTDSDSPFNAVNARRSSCPSTIAYVPLTVHPMHSQPASAQPLPPDATKHTNDTFTTTDSRINFRNLYSSSPINSNATRTMHGMESPLLHGFDTTQSPYLQSQVLVPNPLLSDSPRSDGCMSIGQHFLETNNVLSPTLSLDRSPLDENPVPCLNTPLHRPPIPRTSVSSAGNPVNDSILGLDDTPFSIVPVDRLLLEAHTAQIPFVSTDEPSARSNIISRRDFPSVYNSPNGVSQQNQYEIARPVFESPRLTNGNESFRDEANIRTLYSETSHINKVCNVASDVQLEKMQISPALHVPDAIHAREIKEKDDYYMPISQSTSERYHCGLEADSIPASHETKVSNDQDDTSIPGTNLHLFSQLITQKRTGGHRNNMQAGKLLEQHGQVQNCVFGLSPLAMNDMADSRNKASLVLRQSHLVETSFLGRQQRNNVNMSTVEIKDPPGKRRRLNGSDEEHIEYKECESPDQNAEPSSGQINSCSDVEGCRGDESDHQFEKQKDTYVSHEYQRLEQDGCDMSDHFQVCGRNGYGVTREHNGNTKEEKQTAYLETKKGSTSDQNPGEMKNGQREKERETLEENEGVSEQNETVRNQQKFINSGKDGASSPSHIVRAVEQKEGCMLMVLEVHEPAVCQSCDKKFPTPELLDLHVGKKHNGSTRRRYRKRKRQPKEYRCTACNLRLANDANLRRHYKIVHEGETVETCSLCNANFNSHHGLVLHLRDLHDITPDSVQEKEGRNRRKRQYRRKTTSNVVQKPTWLVWKCGNCSFFSENKGNMTRHINIVHLKIADHVCEECSEVFKTKHNLQVHLMNRHPKKVEGSAEK